MIRTEPGAMYRVTIAFRQEYNAYNCKAGVEKGDGNDEESEYGDYEGYGEKIDEDDDFGSVIIIIIRQITDGMIKTIHVHHHFIPTSAGLAET